MYPRENNFIVHCVVRRPGCTLDVAPSLTPLERCRAQRSVTSSSPSQAVSLTPGPALHSRGSVCSRSDRVLPSPTGPRGDPHSSLGRCHKLMLWRCRVRPSVPGQGRRPLRSLEANLSSRFRPSPPGPRRHPPCPLETNLSSHFRPSQPGPRRCPHRPLETNLSSGRRPSQPEPRRRPCRLLEPPVSRSALETGAEEASTAPPWHETFASLSAHPTGAERRRLHPLETNLLSRLSCRRHRRR